MGDVGKEVLFNRQVNYLIIEKMWEYIKRDEDKENFYEMIDIKPNAYSRIRTADTYAFVDLEKRWNRKNSSLTKFGLSKEIMIGNKMINIDGIKKEEWEEYIIYRYENKEDSSVRTSSMQAFNRKINNWLKNLTSTKPDKSKTDDVQKLYYFFTYGRAAELDLPDMEMVELHNALKNINIEKMKVCDKALRKMIYNLLKQTYRDLDIIVKYDELI